jgi:NAD(P)-dependent dehydrogenase (short-subunit alcohol dehydrogenase family)
MTNIVIGAASGMGAAVARQFSSRGPLIVADRDEAALAAIADELGNHVDVALCDVTDQAQIDALFAKVDVLEAVVNTAGVSGVMAGGRTILDVNLIGSARVLRAAEPLLRPGSVAVCIASQSGYMVPHDEALFAVLDDPLSPRFLDDLSQFFDIDVPSLAYQASKRGVHRLVRRVAATWGRAGARVMSLSPGINDTPMNRSEEVKNPVMLEMIKACPLGRRGTPEEIANVVSFLTSGAASYMTGSDVLVDGGMASVLPTHTWEGKLRTPDSTS